MQPVSFEQATVQTEHHVMMKNRRQLEITGVKQVENFDADEFLIETVQGYLAVRGHQLQMQQLDVASGQLTIKGRILQVMYLDDDANEKQGSFWRKLLK